MRVVTDVSKDILAFIFRVRQVQEKQPKIDTVLSDVNLFLSPTAFQCVIAVSKKTRVNHRKQKRIQHTVDRKTSIFLFSQSPTRFCVAGPLSRGVFPINNVLCWF